MGKKQAVPIAGDTEFYLLLLECLRQIAPHLEAELRALSSQVLDGGMAARA